MFRVPTGLRRVPSAVPPTVVGACNRHRLGHQCRFLTRFFCGGGTQHHPLSATAAKNRVRNRHWGPKRRPLHETAAFQPYVMDMYQRLTQRASQDQNSAEGRTPHKPLSTVLMQFSCDSRAVAITLKSAHRQWVGRRVKAKTAIECGQIRGESGCMCRQLQPAFLELYILRVW